MGNIKRLENSVIEQIAAGEVVERPASIVKELLENSIDAGASRIDIVADKGGLARIKITDNGSGISKEDLPLAPLRHATSKISKATDLYAISTMGFRGEALASASTVSRFTISSSDIGDGMGWSLSIIGGVAKEIKPIQHLKGTTIECVDLFFNMPARKKFLKSEKAEKMAVSKVIQQVILAFPAIHFTGTLDGKKSYDYPPVENSRMRLAQVAGSSLASKLIHSRVETDELCADLYISRPEESQARPRFKELFVNLRKIDNKSVSAAVIQGFTRFITGSYKPNWFLYLDINPNKIDVNVHPTKAEIKFDNEKEIFSLIYRLVQKGLSENRDREFSAITSNDKQDISNNSPISTDDFQTYTKENLYSKESSVEEKKSTAVLSFPGMGSNNNDNQVHIIRSNSKVNEATQTNIPLVTVTDTSSGKGANSISVWDSITCFQIHRQFIIAPVKQGVLLIDQHAAHERIIYERVIKDLNSNGVDSQQLLFPVTIELSPVEKTALLDMRELFSKSGFEIQDFGGNTIAVSAVPATGFVKSTQVKDAIDEMLVQYDREDNVDILSSVHKRFAASYACGAAIKFGKEMTAQEMNSLMVSLFACENPNICPHGRPTVSKITLDELGKRFLR